MADMITPRTIQRTFALAMLPLAALMMPAAGLAQGTAPPVIEGDIAAMQDRMAAGTLTSEGLVRAYLERIAAIDDAGPMLNAVIATFPDAIEQARALDAERAAGRVRGPMHGIPILIKDNIEAIGQLPTTAGSLALADNVTGRDAPLVARLRAAGAVILGKTNLSEWANIRSSESTSGWSAVGGLTRNPHDLSRSACGSSSGSGAAMAAGLAAATIGTETDGSIICPSGSNGVVGFKPTVGLVSRTHIVPISVSQDTAGPMTVSVRDAAIMLDAMAGSDPADAATREGDARRAPSYAAPLSANGLRGVRIGVMRDRLGSRADIRALFDAAVETLRAQGAVIVDIADTRSGFERLGEMEGEILFTELKAEMGRYLAGRPGDGGPQTLADLIAFNRATPAEMRWFGQEFFELAETKPADDDPAFVATRAAARQLAGPDGIDRLRREHGTDLLLGISNGPAWSIDLINGDNFAGPSASQLPAVAGYPHLTVPMGMIEGLPIGLSFIGTAWDDGRVLAAGHAYEAARGPFPRPAYRASISP